MIWYVFEFMEIVEVNKLLQSIPFAICGLDHIHHNWFGQLGSQYPWILMRQPVSKDINLRKQEIPFALKKVFLSSFLEQFFSCSPIFLYSQEDLGH